MSDFDLRKMDLKDALQQLRHAAQELREGVVRAVMRRNQAEAEVRRLTELVTDLERKAALAEKINQPGVAAELRSERQAREADLERAAAALSQAEAHAETQKLRLPEEEASILRQINNLQVELTRLTGIQAEAQAGGATDTDDALDRAFDKVRTLQGEASARVEAAGGQAAPPSTPLNLPHQDSADALLSQLEARLNLPPVTVEQADASSVRFIELDADEAVPVAPVEIEQVRFSEVRSVSAVPIGTSLPRPVDDIAVEARSTTPGMGTGLPSPVAHFSRESAPTSSPELLNETPTPRFAMLNAVEQRPTHRVRVAAIGTGGIFRGAHLPCYPKIAAAQLVALCDPDPAATDLALQRLHAVAETDANAAKEKGDTAAYDRIRQDVDAIKVVRDISEVIADIKPDLVDICTQPYLHTPLAIQALEAGLNVMCEKPISRSWLESQRLMKVIQSSGKLYQHNENWLWEPDYYTAKKLVESGAIGEPIVMFLAQAHGGPEGNGKFWNSDLGGGGALLDNGIHAIGAAWFVCGLDKRPTMVKAAEPFGMTIRMPNRIIDGRFQRITVDDDAHILIRFENPATQEWVTAHVEGSWSERDSPETQVIGTTGKIIYEDVDGARYAVVKDAYDRETRRLRVSGPTWQPWPSSFYGEILNMVECVRYGTPSICTAEFGADCSAIVGASYLSQKNSKRPVHVDEFKRFAQGIADKYPGDDKAADDALVEALLSAVRS